MKRWQLPSASSCQPPGQVGRPSGPLGPPGVTGSTGRWKGVGVGLGVQDDSAAIAGADRAGPTARNVGPAANAGPPPSAAMKTKSENHAALNMCASKKNDVLHATA